MKTKFNKENKHSGLSKFANIFLITLLVGASSFCAADDTDQPGVNLTFSSGGQMVTPTAGSIELSEGEALSASLSLAEAPSGDVTITVTSSNETDLTVSNGSLTFTTDNFQTAQTVTITAVDDNVLEANEAVTLTISAKGGGYDNALTSEQSSVEITIPGDIPEVNLAFSSGGQTVTPTAGSINLSEGEALSASLSLTEAPSGAVTVTVTSSNTTDLTVVNGSLTFTADNFETEQTVTITAVADNESEANEAVTLGIGAEGGGYDNALASEQSSVEITVINAGPFYVAIWSRGTGNGNIGNRTAADTACVGSLAASGLNDAGVSTASVMANTHTVKAFLAYSDDGHHEFMNGSSPLTFPLRGPNTWKTGGSHDANNGIIVNNYQDFFATVGAGPSSTNDGTSNSILSLFDSGISGTSIQTDSTEVTTYWSGLIPSSTSGTIGIGSICNNWTEGGSTRFGMSGRLSGTGPDGYNSALNDNRVGIYSDFFMCDTVQAYLCVAYPVSQ